MISIWSSGSVTTPIPTTLSSLLRRMPFTPPAARPIGLTCFSGKRIDCPFLVTRTISLSPLVPFTQERSSSFLIRMAIIPVRRMLAKSSIGVFLTTPSLVAMKTNFIGSVLDKGRIALIFSSEARSRRLTIGVPLAVLPASGTS